MRIDSGSEPLLILRAEPGDARQLTEIAFAAKRHWGYPERWIASWSDLLTMKPGFIVSHETYKAVLEDRSVGFYALGRKEDRLDLVHLWVLPEVKGRGVGRALFLHAVERTRALGYSQLEIESDPNAEGFYQRLGARRVGSRIREVEQERRELPVLICEIGPLAR
jgi:GNAT superfamily N-acetyltransferase